MSQATFSEVTQRLRKILKEVQWNAGNEARNREKFCTLDSRDITTNPLFKLYYYCSIADIIRAYDTISLMGSKVDYSKLLKLGFDNAVINITGDTIENCYIQNALDARYMLNELNSKIKKHYDAVFYLIFTKQKLVYENKDNNYSIKLANLENLQDIPITPKMLYTYTQNTKSENLYFDIGLLKKTDNGLKLADIYIKDVLNNTGTNEYVFRFCEMVRFYSETQPLGEIGSYILRRLKNRYNASDSSLLFKHNHLVRVINDYNLIDILFAIKNKRLLRIKYQPHSKKLSVHICIPLKVRESTANGRQFLFACEPGYDTPICLRLDCIMQIEISKQTWNSDEKTEKAVNYINCVWQSSLPRNKNVTSVELDLYADEAKEAFIQKRLEKEKRFGKVERINSQALRYSVNVLDPAEMYPWIRSFTMRIKSLMINGEDKTGDFKADHEKMWTVSANNALNENLEILCVKCGKTFFLTPKEIEEYEQQAATNQKKNQTRPRFCSECSHGFDAVATAPTPKPKITPEFDPDKDMHTLLFNGIYSYEFELFGDMYIQAIKNGNYDGYIKNVELVIDDSHLIVDIKNQVDSFLTSRQNKTDNLICISDKDCNIGYDIVPLLTIERQWLINVLKSEKAGLFLDLHEIEKLLDSFDKDPGLFDINDVDCCDMKNDPTIDYKSEKIGKFFRTILTAINEHKKLYITYFPDNAKEADDFIGCPYKIEYSKNNNVFRVFIYNEKTQCINSCNLERFVSIEYMESEFDPITVKKLYEEYYKSKKKTLTVIFRDEKNTPDRILIDFGPWKKECSRENKIYGFYTMKLEYDENDTFEIATKLLGYGPYVYVTSDTGKVKAEITKRLENQHKIFNLPE